MTFTLREAILDEVAFSPRTSLRVLHRWCEQSDHNLGCRAFLRVRELPALGCCFGNFRVMRHVFDCMFRSLAVSTTWMFAPSGGKMC